MVIQIDLKVGSSRCDDRAPTSGVGVQKDTWPTLFRPLHVHPPQYCYGGWASGDAAAETVSKLRQFLNELRRLESERHGPTHQP